MCTKCEKRRNCTKLCEEAEAYVNQDYVPRTEEYTKRTEGDLVDFGVSTPNKILVYQMYFIDGKSTDEIAYHVNISKKQIYLIIQRLKEVDSESLTKAQQKILRCHFLEKMSVMDIEKRFGLNRKSIYNTLERHIFQVSTH